MALAMAMSPSPLRATTMEESESGTEVPEESTMVPITMPGMLRMQPTRVDWTQATWGRVRLAVGRRVGGGKWRRVWRGGWREEGGGGEGGRGARWCVGGCVGVCRVGPAVRRQRT